MSATEDYYEPYHEWFAWTLTDAVSQMLLGSLSALSSALILYIIYRSPVKLKSTYHRIMALLSSCDICLSLSLALSTIPIPKSLVPYNGPTLGTGGTCLVQGIFFSFGAGSVKDSTLFLAIFYVCTSLRVSNWTITRIFEPFFFAYVIIMNFATTYIMFKNDFIHQRHWSAYCGLTPIPSYCWDEDTWMGMAGDVDLSRCAWPTDPNHAWFRSEKIWRYYTLGMSIVLVLAMMVIILVVCRNEKKMIKEEAQHEHSDGDEGHGEDEDKPLELNVTRLIIRQAIMYITAFFLTWILVIIPWDASSPKIIDILESMLLPLGGFWNMLIFVHIKILLVRESNPIVDSNFKAFIVLMKEPDTVPEMVLSGMENVNIVDRTFEIDQGPDDDDVEEGVSEEPSQFTSNPSAYDGLSMTTPSDISHGLSGVSRLSPDPTPAPVPCTNTTTATFGDNKTSRGSSKESNSNASSSNPSDASTKTGTIVNNEKKIYRYYSDIATKFNKRVGLYTEDDSSNAVSECSPNSKMDDVSSTGLSMGGPSYGGLSNEMPAIIENDDCE